MDDTHFTITVFIALLLIASGVAMAAKWIRVPYTLLLVIVGLIISPMHFLPTVHVSPELILLIFLPALLFEAAWNLNLDHLRENWLPILVLSVFGVVVSVGLTASVLHFAIGLSISSALLFGSIISATDPVSVLALFKKMGLPSRLTTIVEGESLFNDGTAVVVFRIILGIVAGESVSSTGTLALESLRSFFMVVAGGVTVGAVIGIVASTLTSYFEDHLLEITLTTIAAYGSFLLAETSHVSPVIAVLVCGLVVGNFGRRVGMSPTTQVAVNSFWEYAAFVVNSLVFLLIGMEIQLTTLLRDLWFVVWAVLAMIVGRAASVYGLLPLSNRLGERVPSKWQHVLFWGGLRGSLSIALALSLPKATPDRERLVIMIFGAVMFSLLAQGLTVSPLIRRLGLVVTSVKLKEYEVLHGELLADAAALAELENLRSRGMVTEKVYDSLRGVLAASSQKLKQKIGELDESDLTIEREQLRRTKRHLLDVRRNRVSELLREGVLSEPAYQELNERLHQHIAALQTEGASVISSDRTGSVEPRG